MEDYHKKDVDRPLTTDEIRLQAHKWTLAGDVGLLAHLEQFSQNLLSKSQETKKNLNALLESVEDTSTTINNVTNEFLALQNSQFVENRVCDDESPTEEFKSEIKISKEEQENLLLAEYKEAVEIGVKLLDSHFEEVQLPPNSDSDEEDTSAENSGLVWKPKNPYVGKRFPLLIGSSEWWADDNVGLGEYEDNINSDLMSPESESDIETEDTAKKHIKISLSTSMEDEKILKEKLNTQNDLDIDDIFVPIGKDMFSVQTNFVERKDGYEGINRPSNLHIEKSNIKSSISTNINPEKNEVGEVIYSSERINRFSFDKTDEDKKINEPSSSMTEQNKFQNAFTRELTAKLSSVANKNGNYSETKNVVEKRQNKDPSALFDENDDSDNLFSAKNSVPDVLFKKDFVFSDEDAYDPLFGNSENLFSESMKGPTLKKTVKISSPKESIEHSKENSNLKPFSKKIKFSDDDVFGSNDDLFSGKSYGPLQNSRGVIAAQKEKREVKFSTPTEQRDNLEVPNADNIFGGVSGIKSDNGSAIENVSAISNEMENSFNFARIVSNETSKDDGFIEPSDISNNKSGKFPTSESPGLFEPRLSSTRHLISDTSDYKTQRLSSNLESHTKSSSVESHLQNNSKTEIGHAEKAHFPREQNEMTKPKSLFADDDEDDDLFQSSKSRKLIKGKGLFSNMENENLFSNSTPNESKNKPLFDDKNENVSLFQKSSSSALFDGDDEKFTIANKFKEQDSASMSSSRSSLFDDINVNKSNLSTVFNKDRALKSSDNFFSVQDDNLFMKKVLTVEDSEKMFSDKSFDKSKKKENKHLSLFEDIGDVDDLFQDVKFTKNVEDFEDSDLFKKHSDLSEKRLKDVKSNIKSSKLSDNLKNKEDQDIFSSEESQILFAEGLDSNIEKTGSKIVEKQNDFKDSFLKSEELSVSDSILFGGTEERDEDLFGNDKSENKVFIKNMKKTDINIKENENQSIASFDENSEYDDIFKNISLKDDITKNESNKELEPDKKIEVKKNVKHFEEFETNPLVNVENTIEKSENINERYDGSEKIEEFKESFTNIKETRSFCENNFPEKTFENNTPLLEEVVSNIYNNKSFKQRELATNVEDGIKPSPVESPRPSHTVRKINVENKEGCVNSETDGLSISTAKPKIVGKLNIPVNLKINPMSLLPGAIIKKKFSFEKEDETQRIAEDEDNLDMEKPTETTNLLKCLSKDRIKIQSHRRPQTRRARHEALRSSGIDFQISSPETTNTTTRSKSVDDFEKNLILPPKSKSNSDTNVNNSLITPNDKEIETGVSEAKESCSPIFHSIENSPDAAFPSLLTSNPLSPSTDEEDYFNIPELDINFEREDQTLFSSSEKDFRGDDNLLFNDAPVLSPVNLSKDFVSVPVRENCEEIERSKFLPTQEQITPKALKSKKLIDEDNNEEDDDDTLFKGSEAKLTDKSLTVKADVKTKLKNMFDDLDDQDSFFFEDKPGKVLSNKEIPKSLFNDNNDDFEDLFGEKAVPSISSKKVKDSSLKNKINKSNVFKKAKEPFIDPLGLMSSKD